MEDGFEAAARAEVTRLRRKADELEAWLARFAASGAGAEHPKPGRSDVPLAASSDVDGTADLPPPSKKGRNAPLLKAIESSGPIGLTVDEVHDAAHRAGMRPNRATIRSFLWNQRNSGRLVALDDGRHVVAKHAPKHGGSSDNRSPDEGGGVDPE